MSLPIAPDNPEEIPGPLGCLITTANPLVSLDIEQTLLDDIKAFANEASRRLSKFTGSGGTLKLDWLNQLQALSQLPAPPTPDGLYCLLHNAPISPCAGPNTWGGGGLLDILAINLTQQFAKTAPPDLKPLNASATLIAAWQQSLNGIQGLSPCEQVELYNDYLDQRIGNPSLTYPHTISGTIPGGLLKYSITDVTFEVDINNTRIVQDLSITNIPTPAYATPHNDIHAVVSIPKMSGKAWVTTAPTPLYFAALALGAATCVWLGIGCALVQEALVVTAYLAFNIVYVSVELGSPILTVDVSLQPDALQRLFPVAEVQFTAHQNVFILDISPNIVASLIVDAVIALLQPLPVLIENQLQPLIQSLLNDSGWRFPILESPVLDQYVTTEASAQPQSFLDAISQQSTDVTPPLPAQIITSEDQLTQRFRDLVPLWPAQLTVPAAPNTTAPNIHLWGGYGISQNYLNLLIAAEWQAEEFAYSLDVNNDLAPLIAAIEAAYPGLQIANSAKLTATLAPDTSPRLLLTPHDASNGGEYAAAFFDDLRICINDAQFTPIGTTGVSSETTTVIDIRFGARMPAEVAFGVLSSSTNQLDIMHERSDRQFEIYYDLTQIVLDPSVQGVATFGPSVAAVTDPLPASMQGILTTLVGKMLSGKNAAVVPRVAGDPANLQRFPFGTGSWFVCQVLPARGNLYMQLGLASAANGIWNILGQLENSGFICANGKIIVGQLLANNPANAF